MAQLSKKQARQRRHRRVRGRIAGTAEVPRLAVFCSDRHVYAQLIDDDAGKTVLSASTQDTDSRTAELRGDVAGATNIGKKLAEKATEAGVRRAVFDRGGFRFHGRVKAVAEGAREGGLHL